MRRTFVTLALLGGAGCGRVPTGEAQELLRGLEAIAQVEPSERPRLLLASCSELPRCADGCEKGLSLGARLLGDKEMGDSLGPLLAQCYGDFRKAHVENPGQKPIDWFLGHFARYVDRAREALPPDGQQRLDALRGKVGP